MRLKVKKNDTIIAVLCPVLKINKCVAAVDSQHGACLYWDNNKEKCAYERKLQEKTERILQSMTIDRDKGD